MSYAEAQARLTDAKRRGDSRSIHSAILDSKRLMTQQLAAEVRLSAPKRLLRRIIGGRR